MHLNGSVLAATSQISLLERAHSVRFYALAAYLAFVFLTGGGSRADIQSLVFLRAGAILMCGFALFSINGAHLRANRVLFSFMGACFGLVALHLLPLPPSIWHALPGRNLVQEIDAAVGLNQSWRPLSLVPTTTWNAFWSLFVPLAALLLGVQLKPTDIERLLQVILGVGMASGFIGLLQVIGDPHGQLYFYHITNNGMAVGLFSNRNHSAFLLVTLIPMLAIFACARIRTEEQAAVRAAIALGCLALLIPLILVTGSRMGLALMALALALAALLYRRPTDLTERKRIYGRLNPRAIIGISGLALFVLIFFLLSRTSSISRIIAGDQHPDLRFQVWGPTLEIASKYFPGGSGIGTFVETYKIDEPASLIGPDYLNHAHNDFLEIAMTAGAPGLLLLALAFIVLIRWSLTAWRASVSDASARFARLGSCVVLILALGSLSDYPLRTPSLSCLFVIALLWLRPKNTLPTSQ